MSDLTEPLLQRSTIDLGSDEALDSTALAGPSGGGLPAGHARAAPRRR